MTGLLSLAVSSVAEAASPARLAPFPLAQVVQQVGGAATSPGRSEPPEPWASPWSEGPVLAVGPLDGEQAQRQLAGAVCGVFRCVSHYRVTSRGRPDLGKMGDWGVDGFLSGAVSREGRGLRLRLDLLTTSSRPTRTWLLPLTRQGRLSPDDVEQVLRDLHEELAGPAPVASPVAPSPPPRPVPDSSVRLARDREGELDSAERLARDLEGEVDSAERLARELGPDPAAARERPQAPVSVAAAPRPRSLGRRPTQWLVAAEVGSFFSSRTLDYAGGPTPLLRGYQGPVAGPLLLLEVFPISRAGDGTLWSGLGLFARYAFSVGLETTAGTQVRASTFSALDAGLEWRLLPFASSEMALIPAVSYQTQSFTVAPSFPGLPDSNLSGVAGSLRTEVPLGRAVVLLLGGRYTRWLRARNLIGDGFFPAGSAFAVEAEAGLGVAMGPLSLRVLGLYDTTRYSLQVGSRPTWRATDASDTQISGRATLRAGF